MPKFNASADQRRALFAMLTRKESLTYRIANARRPNNAPPHDNEAFQKKLDDNMEDYIDVVLSASKRFAKG